MSRLFKAHKNTLQFPENGVIVGRWQDLIWTSAQQPLRGDGSFTGARQESRAREPSGKWPHPTGWRWNKILLGFGWQRAPWNLLSESWAPTQSSCSPAGLEQSWAQDPSLLLPVLSSCHLQRKHWEISSSPHFGPVLAACESFKSAILFVMNLWISALQVRFGEEIKCNW